MDLYERKMETNTNLKYADSSLNYSVIIIVPNFKKKFKSNIYRRNSHSRGIKCKPKANYNRKTVVVCAKHVAKRPSNCIRASILLKRNLNK